LIADWRRSAARTKMRGERGSPCCLIDLHIVDRKGAENHVANNLSRLENISFDPIPVNDSFPNEQLASIKVTS
jgi:hypothetical protein